MKAPLPVDEEERLKALRRYEILDTAAESEFDDIALLASHICGTPIAMVSLVDKDRQWFKSKVGASVSETPRDIAFCAHGILQAEVFVINDALEDKRFATNPFVTGESKLRFYAGAPLITPDGHALGMLCVNDKVPRALSAEQRTALQALSRQVVALLELRRTVAELKRAQEELEWKTAFFEAQVDSSLDGILVVNEQNKKILQNQRTADLLKLPRRVAEDDEGGQQLQWVAERVKNPKPFLEKVTYIRSHPREVSRDEVEFKDGTILDRYSSPVVGKDGKSYGRIFTFRDITERKRAEEQLQWNAALLEAQMNSSIDGILVVDQNRKAILQNQRFVDMMKMPPNIAGDESDEKRLQWGADTIKDPGSFFARIDYLYDHPAESSHDEIELTDGTTLERHSFPALGRHGNYYGRIWNFRDITERKKGEEALRLLGSAVQQSKESIIITGAELDLPGPKIIFVNPAFTKMTGYAREEALGKTPRFLQGPKTDKTVLARLRRNLQAGETFEGEAVNYRKDGKEFDLEWQIAPIRDPQGKITHFVAIQRDITARKRLETRLLESQKMETVGKLAGGVAHEFNSILTAIIGQCEMLLLDLPPGSRSATSATEIHQAAIRAATLTRQLLAYGRKQLLQPELLDLNRVIAGMEGVFDMLRSGNIATQIIPDPGLAPVKADAGQIEQVVMNIVNNARDAMPNGGRLTLETANVSFDEESVGRHPDLKAGDYVLLAISDTGAGMTEEVKARLFEPFFTTKEVGQRTGLGLSTCYGIVKQSGGHISVYSEAGRGTTVKIYLPKAGPEEKRPVERAAAPALPGGTETILLVEDDPALREMAGTLLTRLGYKVWAAANGVEALSLKQQRNVGHIDLLFTDVVMPHMSGKELADRVRSLYPRTRILFTSAYTENASVHQGILDKGVTLLQKPYTPSALARKLRQVLDQGREAGSLNSD
jgi:PAS domain S-box-containing protein